MKFAKATLDKSDYLATIKTLLDDPDCQIFFDTNIFALCYKLFSSARHEFFDWVKSMEEHDRVHSPLWVVNEYTNRFVNGNIKDYFSSTKNISTIQSDLKEINRFLKMNIDSSSLLGSGYLDVQAYKDDLALVEKTLEKINKATKTKDLKYINIIHEELKNTFEKTILNSDISKIFNLVNSNGKFRYNHKFPPGFKDEQKEQNEFGDLIIWQEILEFCKLKDKKKAIFITNDNKKDWMYAPSSLLENGRVIPNAKPFLHIADPRLVFDFFQYTESEQFYIINFETLTKVLIDNSIGRFMQLAQAFQIAFEQDTLGDVTESVSDNMGSAYLALDDQTTESIISDLPIDKVEIPLQVSISNNQREVLLKFSSNALKDSEFPLLDNSFLTEIILKLKSYSWYDQNPAMQQFIVSLNPIIDETQENADKLFVIGRNINQAACGSAFNVIDYIVSFEHYIPKYSSFLANCLFSGMLYEVYFNSLNEFRSDNFKSIFLNELLKLQTLGSLSSSITFMKEALEAYKDSLFIIPNQNPIKVSVEIIFTVVEDKTLEFLDIVTTHNVVSQIKINRKSIITDNHENFISGYNRLEGNLDNLLHIISIIYLIPTNQMEITFDPNGKADGSFKLKSDSYFSKLAIVTSS